MAKCILKQVAISALINEANTHSNPVKRAYTRAAAIIEQMPAADVQPVKRGEWDFRGYQLFKCTNCKEIFTQNQLEAMQNHIDQEEFTFPNFCPNCGADMRGDTP